MENNNKRIVGVYDTEQEAINAVEDLKKQGYDSDDISVIGKNQDDVDAVTDETGTKAEEGLATGAAAGGAIGGVTGLLAGIGALAIPGIGPIVAAGPIAAALTGAAVGAGTGGLAGALIGLGIPEEEAREYNEYVNAGKILVLVDKDTDMADSGYNASAGTGTVRGAAGLDDQKLSYETRDEDYLRHRNNLVNDTDDRLDLNDGLSGSDTLQNASNSYNNWDGETKPGMMTTDRDGDGKGFMGEVKDKMGNAVDKVKDAFDDDDTNNMRGNYTSDTTVGTNLSGTGTARTGTNGYTGSTADTNIHRFGEKETLGSDEENTVQVREEQLNVSKDVVQTGEVDIRKDVVEDRETVNVPVTKEEVYVKRKPVTDGQAVSGSIQEDEIHVPIREEKLNVSKETVVTDEIVIGKRKVQDTEKVTDNVKREELRVEGDAVVDGETTDNDILDNNTKKYH